MNALISARILSKNSKILCFALGAAIASSSCGKKVQDMPEDINNGQQNFLRSPDLMNSWKGPCAKSDLLGSGGYSLLTFGINEVEREVNLFGNETCGDPTFRVKYQGEYTVGSGKGYPEGVAAIDFDFKRVTVTPLSEAGVGILERLSFCGTTDWSLDQEVDLTNSSGEVGCILEDMPSPGYDIFKVQDDQLQLGITGLLPAPRASDQRPKEVGSAIFVRQ